MDAGPVAGLMRSVGGMDFAGHAEDMRIRKPNARIRAIPECAGGLQPVPCAHRFGMRNEPERRGPLRSAAQQQGETQ